MPELENRAFDEQAIPDLKSEAIDFRAASELFAPYRQLTAHAWNTLRITTAHRGGQVPTIGGLPLFGKGSFVRRWSCAVDGGRGEAYRTFPASHADKIE